MDGARKRWDERPLPGARLAAFWLAYGRTEEQVLSTLMSEQHLTDDEAAAALRQAERWLDRETPPS